MWEEEGLSIEAGTDLTSLLRRGIFIYSFSIYLPILEIALKQAPARNMQSVGWYFSLLFAIGLPENEMKEEK